MMNGNGGAAGGAGEAVQVDAQKSTASRVYLTEFGDVLAEEHDAINLRRERLKGLSYRVSGERPIAKAPGINPISADGSDVSPIFDTIGLSLSGGGIRSASFCLGTLQALDQNLVLGRFDYLSMVSGGGYIGISTVATMRDQPNFVYSPGGRLREKGAGVDGDDRSDTAAMGHLRNYSRYLLPRGTNSLLPNVAILLRGWAASTLITAGFVLLAAWATLQVNSDTKELSTSWLGKELTDFIALSLPKVAENIRGMLGSEFAITKILLSLLALYLLAWALMRSYAETRPTQNAPQSDVSSPLNYGARILLFLIAGFAIVESQPVVVRWLLPRLGSEAKHPLEWLLSATVPLIIIGIIFGFASSFLAESARQESTKSTLTSLLKGTLAQFAMIVGAVALPLAIYFSYVWLTAVGVCQKPGSCWNMNAYPAAPWWIRDWLLVLQKLPWSSDITLPMQRIYLIFGILVFALSWLLTPNANSLHSLYRDRLSKAFLFDPATLDGRGNTKTEPAPLKEPTLSSLEKGHGPFPLINAALNIHGSRYLNRRGRDAEFFCFTPLRVGSDATGYAATEAFQSIEPALDIATAMAISGAAVSSNMGAQSLKFFSVTLALLNLRLGYWLKNPMSVKPGFKVSLKSRMTGKAYLFAEALSLLDECGQGVYLTDGGHIENLGLYQLLKRRCRLIFAIDAEADQGYAFSALIAAQRYARIDLGVIIHLPWEHVRDTATKVSKLTGGKVLPADFSNFGKHVAIGIIEYADGLTGWLVYVKASLSGDESDGILDYKRRYPAYPHETTGDQFFSEEQLEVYRALGFHIMNGFLRGQPIYSLPPEDVLEKARVKSDQILATILELLDLPAHKHANPGKADPPQAGTPRPA